MQAATEVQQLESQRDEMPRLYTFAFAVSFSLCAQRIRIDVPYLLLSVSAMIPKEKKAATNYFRAALVVVIILKHALG